MREMYIVKPKKKFFISGTQLVFEEIEIDLTSQKCSISIKGDDDLSAEVVTLIEEQLNFESVAWKKNGNPVLFANLPIEEKNEVKSFSEEEAWELAIKRVASENKMASFWLHKAQREWQGEYLFIHIPSRLGWEAITSENLLDRLQEEFQSLWHQEVILRLGETEKEIEDNPWEIPVPMPAEAFSAYSGEAAGKSESKNKVYIGKPIKAKPRPMKEIVGEESQFTLAGQIIQMETRDFVGRGKTLLTLEIADESSALAGKHFFSDVNLAKKFSQNGLSKGDWVKAKGRIEYDRYSQELVMMIDHLEQLEAPAKRMDHAEVKRVELHAHTQMSPMDAVIPASELIQRAVEWGHSAIAITDHGVVQSFPEAQQAVKKSKGAIKILYGVEGYLFEKDVTKAWHIIIIAKNSVGLQNLYRLISYSHLQYMYRGIPRIPRELLMEYREGLILGSACEAGEFFDALVNKASDEELEKIAQFYDYLEIQPILNNEFMIRKGIVPDQNSLKDFNRKVVAVGEKLGMPVCATGDVHFMEPEDEMYRRILMAGSGFSDADMQPPLYFRTTEEMLEEFSYLGKEKAYEVVVTEPRNIADQVENIEPIPDKTYFPVIPGAEDEVRRMATAKAKSIYGEDLPELISERLETELTSIIGNGFAVLYLIAHKLVKKSLDDGYLVGSRGSVGSSFVATMMDITEVNPLPPHWLCPECGWTEFELTGEYGGGFDLPEKNCPHCGIRAKKEGHDIPFAVFMGFKGDKVPDIDLNFSGDYQSKAHKYTEELFGKDNVFRAGTISTVADKTAYGYAKKYCDERNLQTRRAEVNRMVSGCTGVKRTTGQHPGGIIVVPRDMDIHHFTPVQYPADKKESGTITTHFDYHSIHDQLVKLDILGHDDPTVIRMLEELTGIDPRQIPFDDEKTLSLFSSPNALNLSDNPLRLKTGTLGVPEFGTRFVREMLETTLPDKFSELVRISGFSHGTDVWLNNAQDLIKSGVAKLGEAISTRDDIMTYLIHKGVEAQVAFTVMESVRKGKGVSEEYAEKLRAKDVPEWYIESCRKIQYMFPKAHAVAYVTMAFRIAYCKVHHPLAFYSSYFTVRADDFDADLMTKGKGILVDHLRRMDSSGSPLTAKERSVQTILELALEMTLRGFPFEKVSLYESDPVKFIIRNGGLLPPLASLKGLGETAARNIAESRKKGEFTSIEDLCVRSRIGKDIQEILENHGALAGMPKADQIDLFG